MLLYRICESTEPLWVAFVCVCWRITDIQMALVKFATPYAMCDGGFGPGSGSGSGSGLYSIEGRNNCSECFFGTYSTP